MVSWGNHSAKVRVLADWMILRTATSLNIARPMPRRRSCRRHEVLNMRGAYFRSATHCSIQHDRLPWCDAARCLSRCFYFELVCQVQPHFHPCICQNLRLFFLLFDSGLFAWCRTRRLRLLFRQASRIVVGAKSSSLWVLACGNRTRRLYILLILRLCILKHHSQSWLDMRFRVLVLFPLDFLLVLRWNFHGTSYRRWSVRRRHEYVVLSPDLHRHWFKLCCCA